MLVITLLIVVNGTVQNGEDEARGLCGVGQSVEITRSGFLIVFNWNFTTITYKIKKVKEHLNIYIIISFSHLNFTINSILIKKIMIKKPFDKPWNFVERFLNITCNCSFSYSRPSKTE